MWSDVFQNSRRFKLHFSERAGGFAVKCDQTLASALLHIWVCFSINVTWFVFSLFKKQKHLRLQIKRVLSSVLTKSMMMTLTYPSLPKSSLFNFSPWKCAQSWDMYHALCRTNRWCTEAADMITYTSVFILNQINSSSLHIVWHFLCSLCVKLEISWLQHSPGGGSRWGWLASGHNSRGWMWVWLLIRQLFIHGPAHTFEAILLWNRGLVPVKIISTF